MATDTVFRGARSWSIGALLLATIAAVPAIAGDRYGSHRTVDMDPQSAGRVGGPGLGSRDIDSVADQVMRDLMSRPDISAQPTPPRIVIDSSNFHNNSSQRIDKDMITDALRAGLNRAAAGRIRFISREAMEIVMRERSLKREGVVDVGTKGLTRAAAGVDYQLIGKITSLDARDNRSGETERRTQIVFELVDLETGEIPWTSQPYVVFRASQDSPVYR